MLLKFEVPVDGDEEVELAGSQRQQLAVLDRSPAHLPVGSHLVA